MAAAVRSEYAALFFNRDHSVGIAVVEPEFSVRRELVFLHRSGKFSATDLKFNVDHKVSGLAANTVAKSDSFQRVMRASLAFWNTPTSRGLSFS